MVCRSIIMIKGLLMPFRLNILRRYLIKSGLFLSLIAALFSTSMQLCYAGSFSPLTLPLITTDRFEYIGGFRIPSGTFGDSAAAYAEGPITVGPNGKTIFIVGRSVHQAIAEFSIPELTSSNDVADLNIASVVQPFTKVLGRPETGNPQKMDRIGGMEYVDGELIVNTYLYYDAPANATHTTLVVRDAANLDGASVDGYYGYQARAHASGWISPIPRNLQGLLGGTHITGHSSGSPIISRHSVGPSAFVINPNQHIIGGSAVSTIPTSTLLDFSLEHPLGDSTNKGASHLDNIDLTNDLWTRISSASYGFIVPGTRTYVTIGYSGGHTSGVGYKITQDNGTLCGGPCSYVAADNYNYYWLWDINDLMAVKNGQKNSYEIIPYSYGKFDTPFQPPSGLNKIIGGAFDSVTSILYLTLKDADRKQNVYEPNPVIIAYKLPAPPARLDRIIAQ